MVRIIPNVFEVFISVVWLFEFFNAFVKRARHIEMKNENYLVTQLKKKEKIHWIMGTMSSALLDALPT